MNQLNRITLIGILHLAALSGCTETTTAGDPDRPRTAAKTSESGTTESASGEEFQGEQLIAQPPEGWKQRYATKTPALRLAEFIPEDHSSEQWEEKVSFESLSGKPLPDPIEFVTGIGEDQSVICERFEHLNIQSGLENNYPTSVRLLTCIRNKVTDKGEVTLVKAIQGNDHFYTITRTKRTPPIAEGERPISEAEMAIWAAFMRGIKVCDSSRERHPCS